MFLNQNYFSINYYCIGVSKSCETYCTNNSILCVICDCQTKYNSFLEQYEQQTCQFECNNCNQGICIECLDNYSINIITNTCDSICGDFIINGSEECDDGNLDPNDGCHNCKYVCDNYCKQSKLFLLPYSIFDQICACQINTIQSLQFDQCQIECLTCNYGKCFHCQENYFLDQFTNTCNSFCGDSIINGNEECDDGIIIFTIISIIIIFLMVVINVNQLNMIYVLSEILCSFFLQSKVIVHSRKALFKTLKSVKLHGQSQRAQSTSSPQKFRKKGQSAWSNGEVHCQNAICIT